MSLDPVLEAVTRSEPFERLLLERARPITAHARAGSDCLIAGLAVALESPLLAVASGPRESEELAAGLAAFLGDGRVGEFPAWEALPYEGISPAPEIAARRAETLRRLRGARGPFVVVAPAPAAMQRLVPDLGTHEVFALERGAIVEPGDVAERLVGLGYRRADVVEHRGEFAVRGGIIDAFSGTARRPVRAELDGDVVEALREFIPATQLSSDPVDRATMGPVTELPTSVALRERAAQLAPTHEPRLRDALTRFADGLVFEGVETLAPLLHDEMPTLADLLPAGSWVVLARSRRTLDRARSVFDEAEGVAEATGWPGPPALRPLDEAVGDRTRLDLSELAEGIDLGFTDWGTATGNPTELAARIADLTEGGFETVVTAEGHGSLQRAAEVLASVDVRLRVADDATAAGGGPDEGSLPAGSPPGGSVIGVEAQLVTGFVFPPARLAVATEEDLFGGRRHTRTAPRMVRRRVDPLAAELEPGDFVVHTTHGVGRFEGVVHREIAGAERDYLVLSYAKGDRLSVPSDQVGTVVKYTGGDEPRLHRLGSSDWVRTKGRVRRAVRDMAGELVRLYSVRMSVPGHAFAPDAPWQRELEDAFPHEETGDQLVAIDDVRSDMEQPKPMDRLICGDVGYGKTEVAVRAAFKAVMDGKQVAVLVPTTLLAEQHSVTFGERYRPFPVRVAMLSRFLSKREQDEVVRDLAAGAIDVVIGTHRLLSADIAFKDLGLIIVDEEQRFGVAHKERLKHLRAHVDALAMTATPIPRTLEMALTGIRDLSTVDTPPEDRQPVLTYVGEYDEQMALGAVRRELLRGGQVFWLHNRVATLDRQAAKIADVVPEARVVVAHGQMDEDRLEQEMLAFWEREADVLVCTTIIESGLDVPSANTLIVDAADRLGLAQMYQLRGRVGRSKERAFAYFFFPPQRALTEEANERLATISRHTALGSGFQIAMRDLEIRGAGNLLGAEQHGHIAAVGFETYCRLLQEAVGEMKGEPVPEEREVRIDLPVRAFVPPGWIGQESLRLELYRRIATAADPEALAEVRAETLDRFGSFPPQVETLFAVASLRIACAAVGVAEVMRFKDEVRCKPITLDEGVRRSLGDRVPDASFHEATATLNLAGTDRIPGAELPRWVERSLRAAIGRS